MILKPGMIIDVQIGNEFDDYWCPKAKVLLIATGHSLNNVCFWGVAKFLSGITLLRRIEECVDINGKPLGKGYCNHHIKESEKILNDFLSIEDEKYTRVAMSYHEVKIKTIPISEYIKSNVELIT